MNNHIKQSPMLSVLSLGGGSHSTLVRAAGGSGGGGGSGLVTANLRQHIDFGDTNCYNSSVSTTAVTDLSGNSCNAVISQTTHLSFSSSDGGHVILDPSATSNLPVLYQSSDIWNNLGTGDYTLEFWFNLYGKAQTHMLYRDNYSSGYNLHVFVEQGRWAVANGFSGGFIYENQATKSFTNNDSYSGWKQMVISRSGSALKFYKNGALMSNISQTETATTDYTNNSFSANSYSAALWTLVNFGTYHFTGKFAIFRFYRSKGLSATEVQQNYDFQKARFGLS